MRPTSLVGLPCVEIEFASGRQLPSLLAAFGALSNMNLTFLPLNINELPLLSNTFLRREELDSRELAHGERD